MTISLQGIGVSRGYAIGHSAVLLRNLPEIHEYTLSEEAVEAEVLRYQQALTNACQQLQAVRERLQVQAPGEAIAFIDTHLLMLQDSTLVKIPLAIIRERHCNAEWALKLQRDRLVKVFAEMEDPYLQARQNDVDQVVARIQRLLVDEGGEEGDFGQWVAGRIIIADDLTPADTILIQHQGILAFATEYGGPLSHTAILARSLGIPAVVGITDARVHIKNDVLIIIDGYSGQVIVDPDQAQLADYRRKQAQEQQRQLALEKLKGQLAVTRDAQTIDLYANIELPEDTEAAVRVAADGVGLYRTEFLFMNRSDVPNEEEQLASYLGVLKAFSGRPVTIRTLDLGADKQVDGGRVVTGPVATNPALGLRAIRLCLKDLNLFRPQLRAILRASAHGPVRMMIPMLSNTQELTQVLSLVEQVKQELRERGEQFDELMPVGGMVEVPAAAVCASLFARYLDFLSIGTNDLIQYTLAIDRIDDQVNYLYDPLHPAVLRLIQMTLSAGKQAHIPVSLCGEMASDRQYTRLLLGLGLTQFSAHPNSLLEVKEVIKESDVSELQQLAENLLSAADDEQYAALLAANKSALSRD